MGLNFKYPDDYLSHLSRLEDYEISSDAGYIEFFPLNELEKISEEYETSVNVPNYIAIGINGGGVGIFINKNNMNLTELVQYLLDPESLGLLYHEFNVNPDSEALLIYLKSSLDLESDISIFEIEETEDMLNYTKDGITYYQLFPLDYAIDLIESDLELKDRGYSNEYIAKRLLDYRLNDA